jgi:hypothetical protein
MPLMQQGVRRFVGWSCIALGTALLGLTAAGHFTPIGRFASFEPARPLDRLDQALVARTRSLEALFLEAERASGGRFADMTPWQVMHTLHDVTGRRFSHSLDARHSIFSNWILRLGDALLRPVAPTLGTAGPHALLKQGHSAACTQVSYVLLRLAMRAGIQTRHVGLRGHSVMEAWYDDDWHMYDPDFEVFAGASPDAVLSTDEFARQPELVEAVYRGRATLEYVRRIFDRSQMTFVAHPRGATCHWKGNVFLVIESVAEVLKFALPLLIGLFGFWVLRRHRATARGKNTTAPRI